MVINLTSNRNLHTFIVFSIDTQQFELRAHLYQGRCLLASDDTGLSDPYAKVVFSTYSTTSQVCLSPRVLFLFIFYI